MSFSLSRVSFALIASASVIGCSSSSDPMYVPNAQLSPFQQATFDEYLTETEQWLNQHRVFVSADKQKELDAVMPFELKPENPNGQSVLLVHGLADSPYSFVDIAPVLAEQGYLVRVILLPGHGSRPADLELVELAHWNEIVEHHTQLLKQQSSGVWLGGFSTGTNLVTTYAIEQPEKIEGLLLFSTAYQPRDPMAKYSRYAKWFTDWVSKEQEDNPTRYTSFSMHGAATYYESAIQVQQALEDTTVTIPTFMMLAEADETIDSQYAIEAFETQFTHPDNLAIWYGETQYADPRITHYSMALPEQNVVSASHISPVFSPDNPTYKRDGEVRMCFDDQPESAAKPCEQSDEVWFAAYGLGDESTQRARMTWNPHFEESMAQMVEFLANNR